MRHALVAVLLAVVSLSERHAAAQEAFPHPDVVQPVDSVGVASDSAATQPLRALTLHLEHGKTRRVLSITPRSDGMAEVRNLDGSPDYIALNKIQRVEDVLGMDRTGDVLRKGNRLGEPSSGHSWIDTRGSGMKSARRSRFITDTALLWRMSGGDGGHYQQDKEQMVSLDYGYVQRVGDAYSLGGTAFFLGDKARVRSGLRVRMVRWFSPRVSFDVGPGIVLLGNEEGEAEFKGPGFSGQAGLTFFGVGGLIAEVTSVTRRNSPFAFEKPGGTVHETMWHSGVRLSGVPGVGGTVALGIMLVAALSSLSSSL